MYSVQAIAIAREVTRKYVLFPGLKSAIAAFDRVYQLARDLKLPQGVLLSGPPGSSKTSVADYSLLTTCTHCGTGIGWDRPDVDICRCGRPFRVNGEAKPLEARFQAWHVWLESTLCVGSEASGEVSDPLLPASLKQLSVDGAFRIVEAVGVRAAARTSVRSALSRCQSFEDLGAVINRGIERLQEVAADLDAVEKIARVVNHPELLRIAHDPSTPRDQALASWLLQGARGRLTAQFHRAGSRPTGQLPLFVVR